MSVRPFPSLALILSRSGIGVRISIYVQTLQFLLPAILAFALSRKWNLKLQMGYLQAMAAGQVTMLATGFVLLISAFVQASTAELTAYHALLVLDFVWLISLTSTTCGATLYIFKPPEIDITRIRRRLTQKRKPEDAEAKDPDAKSGEHGGSEHLTEAMEIHPDAKSEVHEGSEQAVEVTEIISRKRNDEDGNQIRTTINYMTFIPVILMSFMSALGLWVFSNPTKFDKVEPECASLTKESFLVRNAGITSKGLRIFWLVIYSICATPFLSVAIAILMQAGSFFLLRYLVLTMGMLLRVPDV